MLPLAQSVLRLLHPQPAQPDSTFEHLSSSAMHSPSAWLLQLSGARELVIQPPPPELAAGAHKVLKGLEAAQEAANATLASLQAALALLQESAEAVVTVERARGLPDDPVSPCLCQLCAGTAKAGTCIDLLDAEYMSKGMPAWPARLL